MTEFRERLQQVLDHYGFSAYRMAKETGTSAANLSNLLSGKFKPSFEFLVKMLNTHPEINGNWLITGQGHMFTDPDIQRLDLSTQDPRILETKNAIIELQSKTIRLLEEQVRDLGAQAKTREAEKRRLMKGITPSTVPKRPMNSKRTDRTP
jgi:transcriptional regulator with XRE-family HTH domain